MVNNMLRKHVQACMHNYNDIFKEYILFMKIHKSMKCYATRQYTTLSVFALFEGKLT